MIAARVQHPAHVPTPQATVVPATAFPGGVAAAPPAAGPVMTGALPRCR
jgi:hypothetical protein